MSPAEPEQRPSSAQGPATPPLGDGQAPLLGTRQERLYTWIAIGVLALVTALLGASYVNQGERLERLERQFWQRQGTEVKGEKAQSSGAGGRRRGGSARKRDRKVDNTLDRLNTFILTHDIGEEPAQALTEVITVCAERADEIRNTAGEDERRGLLHAATAECGEQVAEHIGTNAAQTLRDEVLRNRSDDSSDPPADPNTASAGPDLQAEPTPDPPPASAAAGDPE